MIPLVYFIPEDPDPGDVEVIEPAPPPPQICPEVWNQTPVDPDRAWKAVVALCG